MYVTKCAHKLFYCKAPHERKYTKLGMHLEGVIVIIHFKFRAVLTMSARDIVIKTQNVLLFNFSLGGAIHEISGNGMG